MYNLSQNFRMRYWIFLFWTPALWAQKTIDLYSPNQAIHFELQVKAEQITYQIQFKGQPLVESSALALQFEDFSFGTKVRLGKTKIRPIKESYELIVGKNRWIKAVGNELSVALFSNSVPTRQINLVVRAYDDGLAFRYVFPTQKNWSQYSLLEEQSSIRLSGNPQVHTLLLPHYQTSHEGLYTSTPLAQLDTSQLLDMPTLFQYPQGTYLAISEAALRDYAGMYLQKTKAGHLTSRLSPLPGQSAIKVKAKLPHQSPWRVFFISDKIGSILESNLLTHLNAPCAIEDVSWIKPGKSTWTWWNGDVILGQNFPVGNNFATHQYYIDWCAAQQIEYHAVIEHANRSWYYTEGEGFDPPPPGADVTRPLDSLEMERLAAYSRAKGVGLRVWVHWKPLSEKLEQAFALYQKWNIQGLMVDFMDRDDQEMVNWVEKVLKTAAKYHLHVQFHGAYKPTGLHRTYPNEFTKEGVLNLEALKWDKVCDPEHNLMIPFTRLIAGATDYHAGGFRALPPDQFTVSFRAPHVLGTRAHHLALYVVYESYLQLVSDFPQAYENQTGFEFVQTVPTTWDESRVLDGQVGDYIVTARRKGTTWYIGAMNDWTARELSLKLDFLSPGKRYQATIFRDGADAESQPNQVVKSVQEVQASQVLPLKMAAGGGQVLVFRVME
jgi:alpha-glucosidase